jgi:hypothetical protein
MPGEVDSTVFPGFIEKGGGLFRKPRVWLRDGEVRHVNSYHRLVKCCVCKKPMLRDISNEKKGGDPVCGMSCRSNKMSRPDGFKKLKRANEDSHVMVKSPSHPNANNQGYVAEHRLVMEKEIGRLLRRGEVVHHINLIKTDNKISNLVLFASDRDHFLAHGTLNKCVAKLMDAGVLKYDHKRKAYYVDLRN